MEKKCFKCLVIKPLDCFYKHKEMADGHVNKCKECNKKDVSNNYRENIDHYKKYDLKRNLEPSRKESQKRFCSTKRKTHPIQYAANTIVGNAIRDGKLIKPSNCSNCSIECVPDGHHCDYAYPLDVIWLCRQCHNNWHKVNKPLNSDI